MKPNKHTDRHKTIERIDRLFVSETECLAGFIGWLWFSSKRDSKGLKPCN